MYTQTMERPSKQHHSRPGIKDREKKQVLMGWVVWDRPQDWYAMYLSAGTQHTSIASLYLWWSFREDYGVPGQFLASLMGYQIIMPANKMLSGPEASWHHTAHVHMAKLSHSPERGSCVWELSGAELVGVFKNHTMAHAVSLTIQTFTCQCLVCED